MARGQLEEAFACQTLVVQYPNVCVCMYMYIMQCTVYVIP